MPTIRFYPEEDEKLIDFVALHPSLWNNQEAEYKNVRKKTVLWNEIGRAVNKSGEQCKGRWKSIRDHYKRHKRLKLRGSEPLQRKRALYWERLAFLDTIEDKRNSFGSMTAEFDETTNEETIILGLDSDPFESPTAYSQDKASTSSQDQTPIKRENISPSSDLKLKQQKIHHDNFLQNLDAQRTERLQIQQNALEVEDETDLFFKTMAATVKKFHPDIANETKVKIFSIVMEMETLNRKSNKN